MELPTLQNLSDLDIWPFIKENTILVVVVASVLVIITLLLIALLYIRITLQREQREAQEKPASLDQTSLDFLKLQTNFTETEIKQWQRQFCKESPTGVLKFQQFKKFYEEMIPDADVSVMARHLFRTFDVNNSGSIDFREFLCGLSATMTGSIEEKLEFAFNMYDVDESGTIGRPEILELVRSIHKMSGSMLQEGEEEMDAEKVTDKILRTIDKDRDGEITRREFVEGAKSQPTIVRLLLGDSLSTCLRRPRQ